MKRGPAIGAVRRDRLQPQRHLAGRAPGEARALDLVADHRGGELVAARACAGPGQDHASLADGFHHTLHLNARTYCLCPQIHHGHPWSRDGTCGQKHQHTQLEQTKTCRHGISPWL